MLKRPLNYRSEEMLILTKTYPEPSGNHRETTCVAAVNRDGQLRRIFPVPYRFMSDNAQFKRWHWVRANIVKAEVDHRPESHKIDVDTIEVLESIGPGKDWPKRMAWVAPHIVASPEEIESRRLETNETLGFIRPRRIVDLRITAEPNPNWSEEEIRKLTTEGLFDDEEMKKKLTLRKMPQHFHYVYDCDTPDGVKQFKHKVTDWEVSMLYWNCLYSHGNGWEAPFRQKLETEFREKDLVFMMGTQHRFPDQWLIIGLVYPPKPKPSVQATTLSLFD